MLIPVRLYRKASGEIFEQLAPGESAVLLAHQGHEVPDGEARRLGITAYLMKRAQVSEARTVEAKAVAQADVEDKAVHQDEVEDKAVILHQDRSRVRR